MASHSAPYVAALTVWLLAATPWLYTLITDAFTSLRGSTAALAGYLKAER